MSDLNLILQKLAQLENYIDKTSKQQVNEYAFECERLTTQNKQLTTILKDFQIMLQEKNQKINELEDLKIELQRKIFKLEHQLLSHQLLNKE